MWQPGPPSQWDDYAERARQKLPPPPDSILDAYVTWAPWVAIVFGALGVFLSAGLGLFGALLAPFLVLAGSSGVSAGVATFLAIGALFFASVLDVIGGYLMLQRHVNGWWLLALGLAFSLLQGLFSGGVFGILFTLAIAYIHICVKPRYQA